jgi:hypothetical protein
VADAMRGGMSREPLIPGTPEPGSAVGAK